MTARRRVAAPTPVAPTRTRVRIKRGTQIVVPAADKNKFTKMVNEYFELEKEAAITALRMAQISKELLPAFRAAGVETWPGKEGSADIKIPMGNGSTVIDVYAFRDIVTDEDFMEAVTVTKAAALKCLSGKELDSVSEVTAGKPKSPILVFTLNTDKKTK